MREKPELDQPNENVSVREISLRGSEIGQKGAATRETDVIKPPEN